MPILLEACNKAVAVSKARRREVHAEGFQKSDMP